MGGVIGLPIPEDAPLVLGGYLIQIGKCEAWIVFVVCYVSVVLGDLFIFSVGRYFGPKIFNLRWFNSRSSKTKLKRVRVGIERKSFIMIFLARHLFYLRTVTFLTCGALRMRYSRFFISDAIAALISVPLVLAVGYFFFDAYDQLIRDFKILSVALGAAAIVVFIWYRRTRQPETIELVEGEDTDSADLSGSNETAP